MASSLVNLIFRVEFKASIPCAVNLLAGPVCQETETQERRHVK
jgi:hypothetical protein